ncbi:hypothetical protein QTI66_25190 [Variovorax sp. J22R133]|uniref:hypothetical protein n=1 Tax=Variovorax brevis TaxID=3053503 RepID=UPI002576AD98|nr:hypothetical protein [Variovorax sp. J22R133]MDM0115468.1 hypothetical protein [Variovorax sp. J22R133]
MQLEPFIRVDDVSFSATQEDVLRLRGTPALVCRNGIGLNELDYGDVIYRFQDCGRLEEITQQAPVLQFGNVSVPFGVLASFVRTSDPALFERAGMLVSPRFGLAFDPGERCWVTALAAHCLDEWRAL